MYGSRSLLESEEPCVEREPLAVAVRSSQSTSERSRRHRARRYRSMSTETTRVDSKALDTAWKSYGKWSLKREFYDEFYDSFLPSLPADVRAKFAHTDMETQKDLLRRGISFMLMFLKDSAAGKMAFEKIAIIHDRKHQDIRPEHYSYWKTAFVDTIADHDPEFSPNVRSAWNQVVDAAVGFFLESYEAS